MKNSFNKYLLHRLRSTFLLTLILCILAAIVMSVTVSLWVGTFYEWIEETKESIEVRRLRIDNFGVIIFVLGALCTLMPVVELGDMKNKRNADLIYSLPVSRGKMALVHYLSGLIQIFAIYTVAYATMYIEIVSSHLYPWVQSPSALIGCYFALLAVGVALYSIFMAIFNSANTVVDGCVFIAAWSILIALFAIAIGEFNVETHDVFRLDFINNIAAEHLYPHGALGISEFFYSLIVGTKPYYYYVNVAILWSVVGIICAIVYFFSFKKKRTEELSDLSNTLFGYKVILPIAVFSMTQALDESFLSHIFAILLGVVGYMIYRRSFRIKRNDIITIAVIVAFTSVFMGIL